MFNNIKNRFKKASSARRESGFTLVEILVTVALLSIVALITTVTLINATQANDKFVRGTMNQGQLLNSLSIVTRDISLAQDITHAGKDYLVMNTLENSVPYKDFIFQWKPGKTLAFPGVDTTKLPARPTIIEYKVRNGNTAAPEVKVLVEGYDPKADTTPIFRYFNAENSEFSVLPVPTNDLPNIKRVDIHFVSYIEGREVPMELATSAVPRSASTLPIFTANQPSPPQAPVLKGTLPPGTTAANLNWSAIAGATSYTLSRENRLQPSSPMVITTTTGTSFVDPNLVWGETYVYTVIASGPSGVSPTSNSVSLTVVPDKTYFINIDPKRTAPIAGYTVARDLTNQLTWQPMNGATGYILYRAGTEIYRGPATTFADLNRKFGDTTSYTVLAYNSGLNGSGGNGAMSNPHSLISPPLAPSMSIVVNDTTSVTAGNPPNSSNTINIVRSPNAHGYSWQSGSTSTNTAEFLNTNNATQNQTVNWGSSTWYDVQAYNDAGYGPSSTPQLANQRPGPFSIVSTPVTQRAKYTNTLEYDGVASQNTNGAISANWQASAGANNGYDFRLVLENSFGGPVVAGTADRSSSTGGTSASIDNVTPGSIYQYSVTAKASNGTSRQAPVARIQTAPDVPQSGNVWIVCNNKPDGWQWMNYAYSSNTTPRYGAADNTWRTQFARNNQTAYGTGLDGWVGVGWSSAQTQSDTSSTNYTTGFKLQNVLNLRAGTTGNPNSFVIDAYGTYHRSATDAWGNQYEPAGNTPQNAGFNGCPYNGWSEPSNPCYGATSATWTPQCTMGTGRPSWSTQ